MSHVEDPLRDAVITSLHSRTCHHAVAARLRALAAAATPGPWYSAGPDPRDDEEEQIVTAGPYSVEDRPGRYSHYEDTILQAWSGNGNCAPANVALVCALVSNLESILAALEKPDSGCPWRPIASAPVERDAHGSPVSVVGWSAAEGASVTWGSSHHGGVAWMRFSSLGPVAWYPTMWVPLPQSGTRL